MFLKSSFTDTNNSPIFEITVDVEQDLDLTAQLSLSRA